MGGLFLKKLDVFSFGVLLLEMVNGIRNISIHYHEKYLNLLGYAWELRNESRASDLVDEDYAADRPTMLAMVLMLSHELDLPHPKQHTFTIQGLSDADLRSQCNKIFSMNKASLSIIEGR
ncbi:hypothetical protein ACSBR2_011973 [Camellia fascicularis]